MSVRWGLLSCFSVALLGAWWGHSRAHAVETSSGTGAVLYSVDLDSFPNRLHRHFFVRTSRAGLEYGADTLDPLLWFDTKYLLTGTSHKEALALLDEFLRTHAERQIRDPLKRALYQRDLWAVFDWAASRTDARPQERLALEIRLAHVLQRLALSQKQILALPDNYAAAVASHEYPSEFNPDRPDQAFLPPDLFQPGSSWVMTANSSSVPMHVAAFSGRSRFLVFLRLPRGQQATLDYLKKLWATPRPFARVARFHCGPRLDLNLPQFPLGTEVALLRQLNLFDSGGELVAAPLTESVQIRVFRAIHKEETFERDRQQAAQATFEFELSRAQLFAGRSGGLRAIAAGEKEFPIFACMWGDPFENGWPGQPAERLESVVLDRCAGCHSAAGVHSIWSAHAFFSPSSRLFDSTEHVPIERPGDDELTGMLARKESHFTWRLLKAFEQVESSGEPSSGPLRSRN